MAVLLDRASKVVVQGVTGKEGSFHALRNKAYGTQVVAGVTPGKAGQSVDGVPVFDSVQEAVEATGADVSLVFVPASSRPARRTSGSSPGRSASRGRSA